MAREQFGICAEPNLHSYYLLFNVLDNKNAYIRKALSKLPALFDYYADQFSEANMSTVIAIGANYWDEFYPNSRPKNLTPFSAMKCDDRIAPANNYDLFIEIRSDRADVNHVVSTKVCELLDEAVELIEQVKGFRYLDGRDLTGFVDGTENPKGKHKRDVALVDEESDQAFVKGSYLHIQRYRHNMSLWQSLEEKQQEDIFGRTKRDDIEYASADKPLTAHTKRANLKDANGNSLEILRQSMPYGHMKVQGLFFISYCKTPDNFELMLKSMINGDGHGNFDHMLKYTQAETGAAFFAPSVDFIEALAEQ
ncbi:Dyp-type peroxidase [Thalassomonas sp. M1454]|uniref:Dyp-type peroxidase n=1 Tax=Thalassomonas sp. M1454 TaxID=2594477 RepID=UPI00117DD8C2|nr:Dyp-type peroxidase [Thalassomonas sp. M1454]TRX54037.1 Dyp-type peroxidase [Thalassomonas sp. M1454]